MSGLASDLSQYMINRINVDLVPEWGYQYDKWKNFMDDIVTPAFRDAFNNQQSVLSASAAAKRALFELALLGVSILGNVVLSWAAAKIQYEYLGKYNPTIKYKTVKVNAGYKVSLGDKYIEYDKVAPKVYADMAKDLGKLGLTGTIKKAEITAASPPDGSALARVPNPDDFGAAMRRELNSQKTMLTATIGAFADKILDSRLDWGGEQVKRLVQKYAGFVKKPYPEQRRLGESMLNDDLDDLRRKWAKDPVWFYFGNIPFMYGGIELARIFERELWALWILDQDYKVVRKKMRYRGEEYESDVIDGKQPLNAPIWDRLVELHVIKPPPRWNEGQLPELDPPDDDEHQAVEFPYGYAAGYLSSLLMWANAHGTDPSKGQIRGVTRMLGSITGVHQSILQGY
jgi:hypothetical protein